MTCYQELLQTGRPMKPCTTEGIGVALENLRYLAGLIHNGDGHLRSNYSESSKITSL